MGALEFSLKTVEDAHESYKEDALDVLLDLSTPDVLLMVYLKTHLHLRLKLRVHFRLQWSYF